MLECPIVATTHDEALVQADWYEEQGMQEEADQVRLLSVYPSSQNYRNVYKQQDRRSSCSTNHKRGAIVSFCGFGDFPAIWSMSHPLSKCKSLTTNGNVSMCRSRTGTDKW